MSEQATLFDPMSADIGDLLEHIDDVADDPRIWPKSLAELVDVLADDAISRGCNEDEAFSEARRTITLISHYWGGRMTYLPRHDMLRNALRDNQIWREFCGQNGLGITDLAVKHKRSEMAIYTIIKQQRKLAVNRKQQPLFED